MEATCVAMEYVEGKFGRISGAEIERCVRQGWVIQRKMEKRELNDGERYEAVFPSRLILTLRTESGEHRVPVDRFFKARIGRLTKRRRDAIAEAMPRSVHIGWRYGKGGSFITIAKSELELWAVRTENVLRSRSRSPRK